jgi:hypothetical protein
MKPYIPTIALALLTWATVTWARTSDQNPMDFERIFAIALVVISWFTIGVCVERLRHPRD